MAPAYDICFAYRPDSEWVSQHNLSINGKRKDITRDDLMKVAKAMNIKKANNIIDQISQTVVNWYNFADEVKVDDKLKEKIGNSHLIL